MRCLQIDQIYLFLENELSVSEIKNIEAHLVLCLKCRKAVEERSLFLNAAESLPALEAPPDFTREVMAEIFPEKTSLRSWLRAVSIGMSFITLSLFIFFLASGKNLTNLLVSFNQMLVNGVRNVSILFAKLFKIVSLLTTITIDLSQHLIRNLAHFTTILSLEVQIGLITLTLILSAFLLYGIKRKLLHGVRI